MCRFKRIVLSLLVFTSSPTATSFALQSSDAYIREAGRKWVFGTDKVERAVALEDGRLLLKSFRNRATDTELVPGDAVSDEFYVSVGDQGHTITGTSGDWQLVEARQAKLGQGELKLEIAVERSNLLVTKTYVVYPGSSVIREWVTFTNSGQVPLRIVNPGFFNMRIRPGTPDAVDFYWMDGGGLWVPEVSWLLHKDALTNQTTRSFDSYDAFPAEANPRKIDGTDLKVMLNDRQVWPDKGAQHIANKNPTPQSRFDSTVDVKAGDRLIFVVGMRGNFLNDTTVIDPLITYEDGEKHQASEEFGGGQGDAGWSYHYVQEGRFSDMTYYAKYEQWRMIEAVDYPSISKDRQHPGDNVDVARVWKAPRAGRVRVTGAASTPHCDRGFLDIFFKHGFKLGPSRYAMWNAVLDRNTGNGMFISWDYFGHWKSSFGLDRETLSAKLQVEGHSQLLRPGESVVTPQAVAGLFNDDLDQAGNEFLGWQYQYMWQYTKEAWFPKIRMLGYWYKGTTWLQPGNTWTGLGTDIESTTRKVFRVVDLMRYCGADIYHRDWGWWDKAGDWNGPDWRTINRELRRYDIGLLIYAFIYTVDKTSKVAIEHPDWLMRDRTTLDFSQRPVVDYLAGQLDDFALRWGDFMWRNDSSPLAPDGDDDTPLLAQDQGFREVMTRFLDRHPRCGFQACNAHSNGGSFDYLKYTCTLQITEGGTGLRRNYYASLILPPDKTSDMCDLWDPNQYDKSLWRGLLCINFDMTGDTWDPEKLEGVRELVDIYHYLNKRGVVGRWVKVYRPVVVNDDPVMYFQRMSRDNKRGIIIPKRTATEPVVIKPKGLNEDETYFVSFHESDSTYELKGSELMKNGISVEKMRGGELIYLNLPMHPGSKLDKENPTAPANVTKKRGRFMGYPGVELSWEAGGDNNWVSYYLIIRNGRVIDKLAKGTFYFDHSAGADVAATYEVCTVDGAGRTSQKVAAQGPTLPPARVYDDSVAPVVALSGDWQKRSDLQPAYAATVSFSANGGDAMELAFEGSKTLWFSKLGPECGKAAVSIDGGEPEVVDTYSADDIWGVCVYETELPPGSHTMTMKVLGQHSARSKGDRVYVDGVRIEE